MSFSRIGQQKWLPLRRDDKTMSNFVFAIPQLRGKQSPTLENFPGRDNFEIIGVRSPRRPATAGLLAMTVKPVFETWKGINRQEPMGITAIRSSACYRQEMTFKLFLG